MEEAPVEPSEKGRFRVEVSLPGDSEPRWQWTLVAERYLRWRRRAPYLLAALVLALAGAGVLALQGLASRTLQQRIAELEDDLARVEVLAQALEEAEGRYDRIRSLFGEGAEGTPPLWLPPAGAAPVPLQDPREEDDPEPPVLWPLTERGFLTQGLIQGGEGEAITALRPGAPPLEEHPGIDIAVPSGSYFRAVGPGVVVERGEDPVYGLFVVVEHPLQYRSLYAHASVVVVEPGRAVRAGQVLGLTGSSGRSTAPHLHLELTREGVAVDPLEQLRRP